MILKTKLLLSFFGIFIVFSGSLEAQSNVKKNVLLIVGDDIGMYFKEKKKVFKSLLSQHLFSLDYSQ